MTTDQLDWLISGSSDYCGDGNLNEAIKNITRFFQLNSPSEHIKPASWLKWTLLTIGICFVVGTLTKEFGFYHETAMVWLPFGICTVVLFLFGNSMLPAVFLGQLSTISTFGQTDFKLAILLSVAGSLCAWLSARILVILGVSEKCESARNVLDLIYSALLGGSINALLSVTAYFFWYRGAASDYMKYLPTWGLSDALAVLLLFPLLSWKKRSTDQTWNSRHLIKYAVLLLISAGLTYFSFEISTAYAFAILPLLLWIAVSYGQKGNSVALLAMTTVILGFSSAVRGPVFFLEILGAPEIPLWIQLFIFASIITTMLVATTLDSEMKRRAAEQANASKTQFVANLSHEIRNPVGIIAGFSELIAKDSLPPATLASYTASIQRNAHTLLRLVDDILDISKIEAGRFTISPSVSNLDDFLADIQTTSSLRARQKNIGFQLKVDPDFPAFAVLDSLRVRQILNNLISNSFKFTKAGRVELHVSQTKLQDGNLELTFTITDSGIGISTEQQRRLFKPFAQADDSISQVYGGTGLGLALSKKLAQSMNGDLLLASSEPGRGSTFVLKITCKSASAENFLRAGTSAASAEVKQLDGVKILMVDDSVDSQTLASVFLSQAGAQVECVSNGREALEKTSCNQFDLVLMDVEMPVMDGLRAAKLLRAQAFVHPIVALTANTANGELIKYNEAGFSAFITKPVSGRNLISEIARILGNPTEQI